MNRYGAVGAALLVAGFVLLGGGVFVSLQQEDRLGDLRRVEGTVVSASVEPAEADGFYPNVTYRYAVEGATYTHDEVFPDEGRRPMDRADAEEVVNRYAAGDSVTVFVAPDDPTDAALRAPRSPTPIFAVGFGIVSLAFGFLFAVAGRQRRMDPVVTDEVTLPGVDPADVEAEIEADAGAPDDEKSGGSGIEDEDEGDGGGSGIEDEDEGDGRDGDPPERDDENGT